MKKFFMVLAAVAVAVTSCVQSDDDFAVKGPQKSVQFSLANVITSRGVDAMIPNATKVTLKDCQVFFVGSDGTLYSGMNVNGSAVSHYFATAPTAVQTFHFLPAAVEKVVVVGNYGSEITTATKLDDIKASATTWEDQQDNESLLVYGEAELVKAADDDVHANTYKAVVNVKPLVARIEIGGFVCGFSDTPAYDQVKVTMVALNNYHANATVGGGVSNLKNETINTNTAYPFFNATAPVDSKDVLSDVVLTKTTPSHNFDTDSYLVYHTFAGTVPQLVVRVTGVKGSVESPLYLATNGFKQEGVSVTEFTPGTIYRMNFAFADTALAQPEKCVEVSIEAAEWVIVNVTPEF